MVEPLGARVLAFFGEYDACVHWRVARPYAALRRRGIWATHMASKNPAAEILGPLAHVVVLARLSWRPKDAPKSHKWVRTMRRMGITVVYETDDDLFSPWVIDHQKDGLRRATPRAELEAQRLERVAALALCDGVTASTRRLATVVRTFTPRPVVVVPNAIDVPWFRARAAPAARRVPRDVLTVGWAGGARPDRDVEQMAIAWGQLCQRFPRVRFVVQGHYPAVIDKHVPAHRLIRLPWAAIDDYPAALTNIDIGCCPLPDAPFSRCKTPIKTWEYALAGAAVVASPTVYGAEPLFEPNGGLVARDADEWEHLLAALIRDEEGRRHRAALLARWVEHEHALEREWWRWPTAYAAIAAARSMSGAEAWAAA